jgi:surfactin synthase thioesterase subunit
MGAMLAYRMTLALRQRGAALPQVLVAASWPPRGASRRVMPDPTHNDAAFTADLRRLGGIPDELLDDPSMTKFALPLLRADFRLCLSYVYRPAPPLSMPVIALCGDADKVTPAETLATWREEALDFRGLHLFPGGHLFLVDHVAEVADLVIRAACLPDWRRERAREQPTLPR